MSAAGWSISPTPATPFLAAARYANNFTTDVAPDIIGKAAFDPGWGHYEVFGIARFFNDNTFGCVVSPVTAAAGPGHAPAQTAGLCSTITANTLVPGQQSQRTKSGDGVGGSVLLPFMPKYVDIQASTMYGSGIGRYGAGQLSDVVVAPDGSLSPIKAVHALGGVVVHPWAGLDVYAYAGMEKAQPNYWSIVSTGLSKSLTGFGVPSAINTGCNITTAASFTGGTSNCAAINQAVGGRHRGLLAGLLQRQLWSGRRRVPVGIHPPPVVPGSGRTLATAVAPGIPMERLARSRLRTTSS